jgi:hypothetical protein
MRTLPTARKRVLQGAGCSTKVLAGQLSEWVVLLLQLLRCIRRHLTPLREVLWRSEIGGRLTSSKALLLRLLLLRLLCLLLVLLLLLMLRLLLLPGVGCPVRLLRVCLRIRTRRWLLLVKNLRVLERHRLVEAFRQVIRLWALIPRLACI